MEWEGPELKVKREWRGWGGKAARPAALSPAPQGQEVARLAGLAQFSLPFDAQF